MKTVYKQRSLDAGSRRCRTKVSHNSGTNRGLTPCHSSVIPTAARRTSVYHIQGLWRRNGVFQYRVRVPTDLVARVGTTHINRSLRTTDWRVARRAVHVTALCIASHFDDLRGVPSATDASHDPAPSYSSPVEAATAITLSQAWSLYLDDPTSKRSAKSKAAYDAVRRLVEAVLGPTLALERLTRKHCRDVLETVQGLPSNYQKRLPGLSPAEAVAAARRNGIAPMSVANLNSYMEKFSGLLNWAVKEELVSRNPCRGLRVADPVPARDKRLPFSDVQLHRIFGHSLFDLSGGLQQFDDGLEVARRLIPLIALFSGMRQNEVCQLLVADIVEVTGVACFVLRSDPATGKRLKSASSERIVPVHPALVRAGLLVYRQRCVTGGEVRLWPQLELDRFGYASCYFSKWFGRSLIACGGKEPKTCFHSFRHNFRDALRNAGVDREIAHSLGGWTNPAGGFSVGDTYGRGHRLDALAAAVREVRYDKVAALAWLRSET